MREHVTKVAFISFMTLLLVALPLTSACGGDDDDVTPAPTVTPTPTSTPTPTPIEASCDEFYQQPAISKEVEVAVGDSFRVILCSNPTTGFQWSEAQVSDQTVLKQTDHSFVPPGETGIVGAAGQDVWTFKALKEGESTVSMEYSRPWEGGEKIEWTFTLTVTVK